MPSDCKGQIGKFVISLKCDGECMFILAVVSRIEFIVLGAHSGGIL